MLDKIIEKYKNYSNGSGYTFQILVDDYNALVNLVKQNCKEDTKVKFMREMDVILQDEELDDDEKNASFSVCECMKCHWTFVGECERHGYGFTCESVQIPDYCPMCGSKIEDVIEND